jgi:hypothetical protein
MEIDYIPKKSGTAWVKETVEISCMLGGLINSKRSFLQKKENSGKNK